MDWPATVGAHFMGVPQYRRVDRRALPGDRSWHRAPHRSIPALGHRGGADHRHDSVHARGGGPADRDCLLLRRPLGDGAEHSARREEEKMRGQRPSNERLSQESLFNLQESLTGFRFSIIIASHMKILSYALYLYNQPSRESP